MNHAPSPISDLGTWLHDLAARYGDRIAAIGETNRLSFRELDAAATTWGESLRTAGYGPGHHVGLLAGNDPQWLAAAFGVWRSGATLVPLSTFVTAHELADLIRHADIGLLLAQDELRTHSFAAALRHVTEHVPSLQQVIRLGGGASAATTIEARSLRSQPPADVPTSIACILYTSGTTGRAKGVMLSHAAILATVESTAPRTRLDASDSLLSTLPLFWVAGLVIRALPTLATGCTLILPQTFTADVAVSLLQQYHPTALHLRPPQVGQILSHRDFRPELLSGVQKGGGRSDWYTPHLAKARLITGYGMTEMSGYVTALDAADTPEVLQTEIGTPLDGVMIRVVDDTGTLCQPGVNGHVQVRGPGLFSGYYKEPAGTGLTSDGWFITGDLGSIDGHGTFRFAGRSKDLLRVKGINVSPVEVETVLAAHPSVEAAYVVGLPPDGLDQQVVALIVLKAPFPEDELRAHVARELSHYKRPSNYVYIARSEVALGGTSKPQRAALAELATQRLAPRR